MRSLILSIVCAALTLQAAEVMDREGVFTMEEALERLRPLIGAVGEWTDLTSYLPEGWNKSPMMRRTATASTFAATLELAKEGKLELRQGGTFEPIEIRKRDHGDV